MLGTLLPGGEPGQHLASVLSDRLLPFAVAFGLVPSAPAPRWRASAASVLVVEGGAASLMRDPHIRHARLAPVRHQSGLARASENSPPGDMAGDRNG